MSFLRHREIYQVAEDRVRQLWWARARPLGHARAPRLDESPVGYLLGGLLSSRARLRFTNRRLLCNNGAADRN